MMETVEGSRTIDAVIRQAAEVAGAAVQDQALSAVRAADGCGCRHCRARASQTMLWAIVMMNSAAEPAVEPALYAPVER